MSMQDYETATHIMSKYPSMQYFVGPRPESLVKAAERALGREFPPTYRRFIIEYGAGSFGSSEIYGVISGNFEGSAIPDAVWYTLRLQREGGLPPTLVVVYSVGDGELFCLDLEKRHDDEAPTIAFTPNYSCEEPREIIASDFGEFLLQVVHRELERADSELR